MIITELCTDGSYDLSTLKGYGINRIELCSALSEGGLSPTRSLVQKVKSQFDGDIFCMVRPRSGGFNYSDLEIEQMKNEMKELGSLEIKGVVFGILNGFNEINHKANSDLMNLCKELNLQATFHRAFDMTESPMNAFDHLEGIGFDYLLSSGGKSKALDGIHLLDAINQRKTNLKIIAGSGVNSDNVDHFIELGLDGVHFTGSKEIKELDFGFGSEYVLNKEKILSIMNVIHGK